MVNEVKDGVELRRYAHVPMAEGIDNVDALRSVAYLMVVGTGFVQVGRRMSWGTVKAQSRLNKLYSDRRKMKELARGAGMRPVSAGEESGAGSGGEPKEEPEEELREELEEEPGEELEEEPGEELEEPGEDLGAEPGEDLGAEPGEEPEEGLGAEGAGVKPRKEAGEDAGRGPVEEPQEKPAKHPCRLC